MTDTWRDPAWLADVEGWIDARLADLGTTRTGEAEQPHVQPWSTVLRVPTDRGDVWFKANADALRHEAALVTLLARRVPQRVPPLLASDTDRGWLLMADAGERLRSVVPRERSLARWHDALEATARIQLACEDDVDELLAIGVPDLRLDRLPERYAALLDDPGCRALDRRYRDALPLVEELCGRLAAYGVRDSVQHDDLHDGQVFLRDGTHLVMDWGDACVTHPFLVLAVALQGVVAWGLDDVEGSEDTAPYRESYLGPYAAAYDLPAEALAEAADLATRLGWACRAVNGHVAGDLRSTEQRLRMLLDGRVAG